MGRTNKQYQVREMVCDWALDIPLGDTTVVLHFNSRNNAELVKAILEHEDAHPNEAVPFILPQPINEPLTLDKKRMIAKSCLHYSKSGSCTLRGYAPLDCPRCKEWQSNESNEPLTLEELREMDGEPVYIIAKDMGIAEWNVITGKEPIAIAYDCPMPGFKSVVEGIAFANGRAFRAGAYGITWLAYRRPPEGEANA